MEDEKRFILRVMLKRFYKNWETKTTFTRKGSVLGDEIYLAENKLLNVKKLVILKSYKDVYKDINELTTVEITKF